MKKVLRDDLMDIKYKTLFIILVLGFATQSIMNAGIETNETENFDLYYYLADTNVSIQYGLYVQQALEPLGINVIIIAKQFGQFVGDLLHENAGRPFDLAHVRFGGQRFVPDLAWRYASDNLYFGHAIYQIANSTWQSWQEQDTGILQNDIDTMIYDIDNDHNISSRYDKLNTFNQYYYDNLLYDIPLIGMSVKDAMWGGYGGWIPEEGILESRALGASWTVDTPIDRKANDTTMILSTQDPYISTFDPYQANDIASKNLIKYTTSSLLNIDSNQYFHPDLAWNYAYGYAMIDHDQDPLTADIEAMKYTFFLRDDAFWSETTAYNGTIIPATAVTANDFMLSYKLIKYFLDNYDNSINAEFYYNGLLNAEVTSTNYINDTFTIYFDQPNDISPTDKLGTLAKFNPLPNHLLGNDLTYYDPINMTIYVDKLSSTMSFNPLESNEWIHWASFDGRSSTGPYEMVSYSSAQEYNFKARDDYYYPNEWDISKYYVASNISAWENEYGITFDTWAPSDSYMSARQDAYYWAYNGTEVNMQKPTTQNIESFTYLVILDADNRQLKFDAGQLDVLSLAELDIDQTALYENDPNFVVKSISVKGRGADFIVFNLLNENLKKYNVRKAISLALEREKFVQIHNDLAFPWYNIIYPNSGYWDNIQATGYEYSYTNARDLMRIEGYTADENYTPPSVIPTSGWVVFEDSDLNTSELTWVNFGEIQYPTHTPSYSNQYETPVTNTSSSSSSISDEVSSEPISSDEVPELQLPLSVAWIFGIIIIPVVNRIGRKTTD